ncbi:MAG: hypothetical protein KAH25_11595 [Bacteroidales bacterium]|nr:hypothetical protein [Bacteroidales bacterium]
MDSINLSNSVNTFDVEKQNLLIKRWSPKVKRALKNSAKTFQNGKKTSFVIRGGQTEGKLSESIKARLGKQMGVIELVSFSFERHGVFVHKGVGRGYELQGSAVVRTAKNPMVAYRNPVAWFNPILEKHIPELANRIAEINTNAAVNATKLNIK